MLKHIARLAGAAATAAAILALAAGPAAAASTFTIADGGTGRPAIQQGSLTLKDGSNTITCTGGGAAFTFHNGSGQSGTGLGTISSLTWTGCTGPLGIIATITATGNWSVTAIASSDSVTSGFITELGLSVSGIMCTATILGTVAFNYYNSTGVMAISPYGSLLKVTAAKCLYILNKGDDVQLNTSFKLTNSPYVLISSP